MIRKDSFLDDQKVKYTKSTYMNRKSAINKFEDWLRINGHKVKDLSQFDINEFFKWLIREDGASMGEYSAYQYLTSVRKYFKYVPELDKDVCDINTSWIDYTPKHTKPTLAQNEIRELVKSAESKRGEALISLMASTGMRLGEAVRVEMGQLYLDERMIKDLETIKTDYGKRTVYFDRSTRRTLREYINKGYRGKYPSDSDYLFVSEGERSKHMSTDRGRVEFNRAVRNCDEIKDKVEYEVMCDGRERCTVSTHILRRSFCQNWVDSGGDIMSLKNIVGWEDLETAKDYLDDTVTKQKRDSYGLRL